MNQFASQLLPCLHCLALTSSRDQLCCSGCRFVHNGGFSTPNQTVPVDSLYDQEDIRIVYNLSQSLERPMYRLRVQGLQCSSCVHILEDLPLFLNSVLNARVNFAKGELLIETSQQHSLGLILKYLESMGYPAHPLKGDELADELNTKEDRALLLRLAVAGACAGNIMLFSVAIYGGLIGETAFTFNGISLLLFLPVLFYSAQPFYRGAWNSLRLGYLTVDVPLVAALWLSFSASLFNWWRGSGNVYFDSTAGFFFFILLSRWFLRTSQRRWGHSGFSQHILKDSFFKIERDGSEKHVLASQILEGDVTRVEHHQRIPVDGVLVSPRALLDTSWMTGEAVPRSFDASMTVHAGDKVLSDFVLLRATSKAHESQLAQSLRRVEATSLSSSTRMSLFDKAAQWLLLGVFVCSGLILVLGPWLFGLSWDDAFERCIGLLVVACPCAIAFGGPLAYGISLKRALEMGIVIKSADVLDRVLECKNIVFDKTGTLTLGKFELVRQKPASIPDWMKEIILELEKKSHHPVADAFRKSWISMSPIELTDVTETPGKKVFGLYEGRLYSVQTHTSENSSLCVAFLQDEKVLAIFEFEDTLREETPSLLAKLEKYFTLNILSGDRTARVKNLIPHLGAAFAEAHGDLSPQDKSRWILNNPKSLMLGDGVNDVEALSRAHVGILVQGPLAKGLNFGSAYFMQPGLESIKDLLNIAYKNRRIVQHNLFFALIYNVTAGAAAVSGLINPLMAAALMPLSSLLILVSTLRVSR
jgi:Cu2+-exporting ATPase/Cu+-exporting ATPase